MGKKPQHKQQRECREQPKSETAIVYKASPTQPMSQADDPPPTKQEIERRRKLYFSQQKRPNPPAKAELQYFRDLVTDDYIADVFSRFDQLRVTRDLKPTFELKPLFEPSLVKRALKAAFLLFSQELNCIQLTIPGIPYNEYSRLIEETKKAQGIKQEIGEIFELPANKNAPAHGRKLIVVGDTHGTFEVLYLLLTPDNLTPDTMFLFNGDYVDRGSFSIEIIMLLVMMKLAGRPVHMLRGNHEICSVCQNYSFKMELERKYPNDADLLFDLAVYMFYALPLAATINDSWFVVHGGLSGWTDFDIFELNKINRFRDPESDLFHHFHAFDPLNDLLWADPSEQTRTIAFNDTRGSSVKFGEDAVRGFLRKTNLSHLLRSHTCVQNGYEVMHSGITYTLFSVPKYNQENLGAYFTMYGVYDYDAKPSQAQLALFGTGCTAYDCYMKNPTTPRVFIRQISCSDNSSILNQPLIDEMSNNMMKRNFQAILYQFGSIEEFQNSIAASVAAKQSAQ